MVNSCCFYQQAEWVPIEWRCSLFHADFSRGSLLPMFSKNCSDNIKSTMEMFEDFLNGASGVKDGFTLKGVWDRRALGRRHMAVKECTRASFSQAAPRRAWAPQPHSVDRAASAPVSEQTRRLSVLSWNPGPKRGTLGAIEQHIAGPWHVMWHK